MPASTVFLVERDPATSAQIGELLTALNLRSRVIERMSDIFKVARTEAPGVVMIDLVTVGASDDPHSRMGSDHVLRVLRQMYPKLCIVVLSASSDPRIDALAREFQAPVLIKPFESAELRSVLEDCGVLTPEHRPLPTKSRDPSTAGSRQRAAVSNH